MRLPRCFGFNIRFKWFKHRHGTWSTCRVKSTGALSSCSGKLNKSLPGFAVKFKFISIFIIIIKVRYKKKIKKVFKRFYKRIQQSLSEMDRVTYFQTRPDPTRLTLGPDPTRPDPA